MGASSDLESLRDAVARMTDATTAFVAGDVTRWKECCSHGDDATIAGGWGAYERGWDAVGERYSWAASRYRGGELAVEVVSMGASGDLGYTFHIERQVARLEGVPEPVPVVLRVTHIYRREDGEWRRLHRHADPVTSKQAVETVIQR
jgi:ketosteroid isomerase-like protein